MKTIAFQAYLDCVCEGVPMRFYSNPVNISVEERTPVAPVRKSIKIVRDEKTPKHSRCFDVDLFVALLILHCL